MVVFQTSRCTWWCNPVSGNPGRESTYKNWWRRSVLPCSHHIYSSKTTFNWMFEMRKMLAKGLCGCWQVTELFSERNSYPLPLSCSFFIIIQYRLTLLLLKKNIWSYIPKVICYLFQIKLIIELAFWLLKISSLVINYMYCCDAIFVISWLLVLSPRV